jgi:pyrophosphatase PpaX
MIKAVLFDLDDTLLDSLKARVKALERVFAEAGINNIKADDFIINLQGNPFVTALKELAQYRNIHDDLFVKYRRAYWFKSQDRLQLFPGVREMLENLKNEGCELGIVTSKLHDTVFEGRRIGCGGELERTGIAGLLSAVIGLEDVTHPKPDPECIYLALSKIGVSPVSTLVVGDSAADIAAAKAAGCKSCRATWGLPAETVSTEAGMEDFIASEPHEVVSIITQIS